MRKLRGIGHYFLATAIVSPLLVFNAAAQQSNVTQLLQRTNTPAGQLARDVQHMEKITR
jgi:hypothetical protein